MSKKQYGLLVPLALTALVLIAAVGHSEPATSEERSETAAKDSIETTGGYFLFLRGTPMNSSRTLVLAEARPDGLDLRDVATGDLKGEALCAVDGKVYMVAYDRLYAIDLATGERHQIPSFGRYGPYCYDMKRLYRAMRGPKGATLRLYDFARCAYRDVTKLPGAFRSDYSITVSPDHGRLAYCKAKEPLFVGGFMLVVVNLNTGTSREVGPLIEYYYPSSHLVEYPPFVWLDSETVLVVRMSKPTEQGSIGEPPYMLTTVNVLTGDTRDVLTFPGDPAKLRPPAWDGSAHVTVVSDRYRIDIERGRLVRDYSAGELFHRIPGQDGVEVLHANKRIDFAERWTGRSSLHATDLFVSPDGQRVLWGIHDSSEPQHYKLKYYDARDETVRLVTEEWDRNWVLWVDAKDLQAPPQEPPIPTGSTSLFAVDEGPNLEQRPNQGIEAD